MPRRTSLTTSDWLILIDIDGTLMTTAGIGPVLMKRAADQALDANLSFERVDFSGNLDPLIVAEAARHADHPWDEQQHGRFRAAYADTVRDWLRTTPPTLLPGAHNLVNQLAEASIPRGLLTGNYPETAQLKIDASGLDFNTFTASAFGSDGPDRPALVRKARQRHTHDVPDANVVVIGDTPRDVHCARANNCTALAVTTGRFSHEDLADAGADHVMDSLDEAIVILADLGAPL
ncbi:HAD family hydrolase [Mucisphaera calidilacus]|uniref:phosphoglycolate phosphatase n=1 Tax=Mucisphaera calidilacus TaxID=2527982 RepID=A0A518BWB4_9BACT|nr:HAD family hydrolase [Mucisphaera calidilacus]QDU71272.1 Phosphoglycolate phosphatase [Mucisphaera calidilacus]